VAVAYFLHHPVTARENDEKFSLPFALHTAVIVRVIGAIYCQNCSENVKSPKLGSNVT